MGKGKKDENPEDIRNSDEELSKLGGDIDPETSDEASEMIKQWVNHMYEGKGADPEDK